MEEKNVESAIPETSFTELLILAQEGNPDAVLKIIEFYKEDIYKVCRFISLPREDAIQSVITNFIEELKNNNG